MTVIIKAYGPFNLHPTRQIQGQFLKSYDPEAFSGLGDAVFTDRVQEALKFPNMDEALHFTLQVPWHRPIREDGRPNRPIRAFTLEFGELG